MPAHVEALEADIEVLSARTAELTEPWAGRCPGQRESAGRKGSAKPCKGSPWLADVLIAELVEKQTARLR